MLIQELKKHLLRAKNQTELDLSHKLINNLQDLIEILLKFPHLSKVHLSYQLSLWGNKLTELPKSISLLSQLTQLNIKDNPFVNVFRSNQFQQIIETVSTLPNLKSLYISTEKITKQFIIESLPKLERLNNQKIKRKIQKRIFEIPELNSDLLEHNQFIFKRLGQMYADDLTQNQDSDQNSNVEEIVKDYYLHKQKVQQAFNIQKNQDLSNQKGRILVLKTHFQMANYNFQRLIDFFNQLDQNYTEILQLLYQEYNNLLDQTFQLCQQLAQQKQTNKQNFFPGQKITVQKTMAKDLLAKQSQQQFSENITSLGTLKSQVQYYRQKNENLQQQVQFLEKENKLYLQKIMKRQKQFQQSKMVTPSIKMQKQNQQPFFFAHKPITLQNLKEIIKQLYLTKKDSKETMQQHMYAWLNKKYGLRKIVIEWAAAIINAIKNYHMNDIDVSLFGQILNNGVDQDFVKVQEQLKSLIQQLLKTTVFQMNKRKTVAYKNHQFTMKLNGFITKQQVFEIITYMYAKEDVHMLKQQLQFDRQKKIPYKEFQHLLLNYQLQSHKQYLSKFRKKFEELDEMRQGKLSEYQLNTLCSLLNKKQKPSGSLTFSESVKFFEHQIPQLNKLNF